MNFQLYNFITNYMKKNYSMVIICLLLAVLCAFLGVKYYYSQQEAESMKEVVGDYQDSKKIIEFTDMFVADVLQAEGEVDFETRLKLENAVRDLNNKEIFNAWQSFVNSQTEAAAQENVESLLALLVSEMTGN